MITVYDYCQAFRAWALVTHVGKDFLDILEPALDWLSTVKYSEQDEVEPDVLCGELRAHCKATTGFTHVVEIEKSNLLARMIYGGEKLRKQLCPVHQGRWTFSFKETCDCSDGGYNLTGYLPEPEDSRVTCNEGVDGYWIARIPAMPSVIAYGLSEREAYTAVRKLARAVVKEKS